MLLEINRLIMNNLDLKIVSPEKVLFEGQAVFVKLPGLLGDFSLLSYHAPLISSLSKGVVFYRIAEGTETSLEITGGFAEVSNNSVTVCVESVIG